MCGDAEEQKPSAHDIALAQQAAKNVERFEEIYMPLEIFEIEQLRDPAIKRINKSVVEGRINADVARNERAAHINALQAAQASGSDLSSQSNQAGLHDNALAAARASSVAELEAERIARDIHDNEALSVIRTGEGINRGNTENLANVARMQNYEASAKLKASQQKSLARAKALGDVATAAIVGGYDAFKQAKSGDDAADLSAGGKILRGLGVGAMRQDPSAAAANNTALTVQQRQEGIQHATNGKQLGA